MQPREHAGRFPLLQASMGGRQRDAQLARHVPPGDSGHQHKVDRPKARPVVHARTAAARVEGSAGSNGSIASHNPSLTWRIDSATLHLPVAVCRTGDPEVAADFCAETFAAALDGVRRFDPERGPAVAWLYGIPTASSGGCGNGGRSTREPVGAWAWSACS